MPERRTPQNTPVDEWYSGWLVMEVASILNDPSYITKHDWERLEAKQPVTMDDMKAFIKRHREGLRIKSLGPVDPNNPDGVALKS